MRSVDPGHTVVNPPARAERGGRWSDMDQAVRDASLEIEAAVVDVERTDDRSIYRLKLVDDRPGELVLSRTGDDHVYDAAATIGRFRDDTATARRLLAALDRTARAYGAKRSFNED